MRMINQMRARIMSLSPLKKKVKPMFEKLIYAIESEAHVTSISVLLQGAQTILETLESHYAADGNLRDTAIDAVCQLLQSKKTKAS